jgi:hypothetical protein
VWEDIERLPAHRRRRFLERSFVSTPHGLGGAGVTKHKLSNYIIASISKLFLSPLKNYPAARFMGEGAGPFAIPPRVT